MIEHLRGVIIPVATPFDDDGALSTPMLEDNFGQWAETSVRGYMCLGSNGEFRSLSDEEALAVVETAVRLKGNRTLIIGVGRESLRLTCRFLDSVLDLGPGVDYVSVLTPHYFARAMDDQALLAYYLAVADHSRAPVLIYVAPGFANSVTVPPATIKRLADHPNIHGMKDTSPAMMVEYTLSAGGRQDFAILAGSLDNLMTCLALGGAGGVVSAANYFPSQCARVTDLFFSGRRDEAVASYLDLQRVVKQTAARHGVAGLKYCMDLCGLYGGKPRLPVRPLSSQQQSDIRAVLISNNMITA